jgi:hypothetical protein
MVTDRKDAFLCSVACRVRGHRNGQVREHREFCADLGVSPGYFARNMAARALCPDLLEQSKGRGGLDSITADIWAHAHQIANQQELEQ